MQDQAPASAGESSTAGPRHELTEDYERTDDQFFSVALAGIAAGQPGGTGLGLANEGGITIEMSDSQASWQDRPYQQEVTMTNPRSWGYDLAGGEAAGFTELSGQMASREQDGIEQDEAGQALRSPGMTPSAEKPASGRPWPHRRRHVRAVRPGCPGLADDVPGRPVAVALATAYCRKVAVHAAQESVQLPDGTGFTWEHPAHLYLTRPRRTRSRPAPRTRTRAALATLVDLPPP
jgi:hypothetical protein